MKPVHLSLTVDVHYRPNGMTAQSLKEILVRTADTAVQDGMLTADSEAEVLQWRAEVREVVDNDSLVIGGFHDLKG